eukprot:gene4155-5919_t
MSSIASSSPSEQANDLSQTEQPTIVANANLISKRMSDAAEFVNRNSESIRLVAVSKTKSATDIKLLYEAGHRNFGENYFQELLDKAAVLPSDICWHFIGHLQSAKANKLIREVPNLAIVETVDSIKLANKLNNACKSYPREPLKIFLQVDTSGEATKSGLDIGNELIEAALFIVENCPKLQLCGLMTIGAPDDFTCFDKLVSCRNDVAIAIGVDIESLELSMGMSGDFEEAIKRGATSVRVGSLIFGERIYNK